jgi:hypothetical protein
MSRLVRRNFSVLPVTVRDVKSRGRFSERPCERRDRRVGRSGEQVSEKMTGRGGGAGIAQSRTWSMRIERRSAEVHNEFGVASAVAEHGKNLPGGSAVS